MLYNAAVVDVAKVVSAFGSLVAVLIAGEHLAPPGRRRLPPPDRGRRARRRDHADLRRRAPHEGGHRPAAPRRSARRDLRRRSRAAMRRTRPPTSRGRSSSRGVWVANAALNTVGVIVLAAAVGLSRIYLGRTTGPTCRRLGDRLRNLCALAAIALIVNYVRHNGGQRAGAAARARRAMNLDLSNTEIATALAEIRGRLLHHADPGSRPGAATGASGRRSRRASSRCSSSPPCWGSARRSAWPSSGPTTPTRSAQFGGGFAPRHAGCRYDRLVAASTIGPAAQPRFVSRGAGRGLRGRRAVCRLPSVTRAAGRARRHVIVLDLEQCLAVACASPRTNAA